MTDQPTAPVTQDPRCIKCGKRRSDHNFFGEWGYLCHNGSNTFLAEAPPPPEPTGDVKERARELLDAEPHNETCDYWDARGKDGENCSCLREKALRAIERALTSPPELQPKPVHRSDCAIYNEPVGLCDCHLTDPSVPAPSVVAGHPRTPAATAFIDERRREQDRLEVRERIARAVDVAVTAIGAVVENDEGLTEEGRGFLREAIVQLHDHVRAPLAYSSAAFAGGGVREALENALEWLIELVNGDYGRLGEFAMAAAKRDLVKLETLLAQTAPAQPRGDDAALIEAAFKEGYGLGFLEGYVCEPIYDLSDAEARGDALATMDGVSEAWSDYRAALSRLSPPQPSEAVFDDRHRTAIWNALRSRGTGLSRTAGIIEDVARALKSTPGPAPDEAEIEAIRDRDDGDDYWNMPPRKEGEPL